MKPPKRTQDTTRTIIISNRLPVKLQKKKGEWRLEQSEGGLATGLGSAFSAGNFRWIGWPGAQVRSGEERSSLQEAFDARHLSPVWLDEAEIKGFYEGFSNETLWPIFHYFPNYAKFNLRHWEIYQAVNKKFAEALLKIVAPGDIIWIHDYQLLLLPGLIRQAMPDAKIGFFQHIPFPSYEIFRIIPWRKELLQGLLGADLIGFHTYDDARHFSKAAQGILNLHQQSNELIYRERRVIADAFPMGIDYAKYHQFTRRDTTGRNKQKILRMTGERKLMISIDRLDYSKGIPEKLEAYRLFLQTYPEFREKIVFLQLVVPSRTKVKSYAELKENINRLVSDINASYGSLNWQPVQYFYRALPLEMLSALYAVADIALITPLRDGMNLVSKEFIASKEEDKGVLILSEFAGASKELYQAIIVNPFDPDAVSRSIQEAFLMPEYEQQTRMRTLRHVVEKFDVHLWIRNFISRLEEVKEEQALFNSRRMTEPIMERIRQQYIQAGTRLIFLDYDGTLVNFKNDPQDALPDEELMRLLQGLVDDPKNRIVLISGRKRETLDLWFDDLQLDMVAEHGAWVKIQGRPWQPNLSPAQRQWKDAVRPLLKQYENRTPGTFVEDKTFSLSWHYRNADKGLGALRAIEIMAKLRYILPEYNLKILEGNKVLEVKSADMHKGKAVKLLIQQYPADFILAMGDDVTDEDIFLALPQKALSVKIGTHPSAAGYFVQNVEMARALLFQLKSAVIETRLPL